MEQANSPRKHEYEAVKAAAEDKIRTVEILDK